MLFYVTAEVNKASVMERVYEAGSLHLYVLF